MGQSSAPQGGQSPGGCSLPGSQAPRTSGGARLPGRASGASEAALGTTKEVLGFIIDFLDFKDFLGFPILLLGFPRISIRILSGF